jgi:mRNA interferase MazF
MGKQKINQFEVWLADLNPQIGTEPGKMRPVLIVQSNLLNRTNHPSTLVCPITSNVNTSAEILRVHLKNGESGLERESDILIDQLRAIDNRRLMKRFGKLPEKLANQVKANMLIVLDLEERVEK